MKKFLVVVLLLGLWAAASAQVSSNPAFSSANCSAKATAVGGVVVSYTDTGASGPGPGGAGRQRRCTIETETSVLTYEYDERIETQAQTAFTRLAGQSGSGWRIVFSIPVACVDTYLITTLTVTTSTYGVDGQSGTNLKEVATVTVADVSSSRVFVSTEETPGVGTIVECYNPADRQFYNLDHQHCQP